MVQVAYVGSVGRHLPVRTELNQLLPLSPGQNPYGPGQAISADDCSSVSGTAASGYTGTVNGQAVSGTVATHLAIACGVSADPSRPFYGISGITHGSNIGQSQYDALQIGVSRYFGHLNGSLAYTYGHSIDDGSDGAVTEVVNAYNPQQSLASSNFDERHVLEASLVYDLPFFTQAGLLHSVLGGWQISDLTSFQSGTPFSMVNTQSADNAGTGNTVSNNGTARSNPMQTSSGRSMATSLFGILRVCRDRASTTAMHSLLRRGSPMAIRSQCSHFAPPHEFRHGSFQELHRARRYALRVPC